MPKSKVSNLAPVVQTLDSAIHWINHYPLDNSIGFADSDLSGGQRYPTSEQLGPEGYPYLEQGNLQRRLAWRRSPELHPW